MLWENNELFKQYLKDLNKNYSDEVEFEMRKETFIKNFHVARHQSGTALMRLNQFADWYDSEYHYLIRLEESPNDPDQLEPFVPLVVQSGLGND